MKLEEALDTLKDAGFIAKSHSDITLAEFNRRISSLDAGWEIGKLNGNNNPSSPWILSKLGIGMIKFSTFIREDTNGLGLVCYVRGLSAVPDENAKKNINSIFNNIFGE